MSRNDAEDFAQRLYTRLPVHYRVRDAERSQPLLALLRVVGAQVANLRRDLDDLWDNFFIETCDDWVVPYLGALVGTRMLANPLGQSGRLDVWNTVAWRRSRGSPLMLQSLATSISGWPTDFAEFWRILGWSQNVNHLRLAALLTPDLRNPYPLSLLGQAGDPLLHAADFKPSFDLDQSRVTTGSLGIGVAGWPTPGRYQIRNLGFFVHRLQTFPVYGATAAAADPGAVPPAGTTCFTFDPLHRKVPLFAQSSAAPITRAAFDHDAADIFGSDIAVRQHGVPLATAGQASPALTGSGVPFTFGTRASGWSLDVAAGMRLLDAARLEGGGGFVIGAEWEQNGGSVVTLGKLGTAAAASWLAGAFQPGGTTTDAGVLRITLRLADSASPWPPPPFSTPRPARFAGAVLALRAAQAGAVQAADGVLVYLPSIRVGLDTPVTLWVADDGSTYWGPDLAIEALARSAEGQAYPAWSGEPSALPARDFTAPSRGANGLVLSDPSRFGGSGILFAAEMFTGVSQVQGAIATADASGVTLPGLPLPALWPAFTYVANPVGVADSGAAALLDILVQPLPGQPPGLRSPPCELVVTNRGSAALLVYLPEIDDLQAEGIRFLVADDGSTYYFPADPTAQADALANQSLAGLVLARASAGQVWPIEGNWPLQRRIAIASTLCRPGRTVTLRPGQLGIDPECGRFALSQGDPVLADAAFTVDYVEAFSDRVGALNFDRQIDPAQLATRLVSSSGDADPSLSALPNAPVHASLAAAVAAAADGDVIEIVDSATYAEPGPVVLADDRVTQLSIRARAGQRPCLAFYAGPNLPAAASLLGLVPMQMLALNGLLVSGGPVVLHAPVAQLQLLGCTLDPNNAAGGSLIADAPDLGTGADFLLCRCISGGLQLGDAVRNITVADSILDAGGELAIAGAVPPASPSEGLLAPPAPAIVQLERVTVFGRVMCDVLNASECLLDDTVSVEDQQTGCIRFSRYETGSILPRRYRCVPSEEEVKACSPSLRCVPPRFNSRRFGRPAYAQLAASCSPEILTASAAAAEVGAFASRLDGIRLGNLRIKLQEFMPVGLSAVIVAAT
jgi:hypothetical protein